MIPARFKNAAAARGRYGDRVDRLAPYLLRTDPLADALAGAIDAMPAGQGWRLFSWVFFEVEPWNLVLGCLGLYWFGRDLAARWGAVRFVVAYLGLAATVGALTVVASLFYTPLQQIPQVGSWALLEVCPDDPTRSVVTALAVEAPLSDYELPRYAQATLSQLQMLAATRKVADIKGRLQRVNPVEEAELYHRTFAELIQWEATARGHRDGGIPDL